jgi:hypothetical protein
MFQLQPGALFAGYHVVRHIADGNVGELYEVAAPDGAPRALKRLRQDAADSAK